MSDDPIISALARLEAGQTAMRSEVAHFEAGQTAMRSEMGRLEAAQLSLRVDLMARMDRLQDSLGEVRDDMAVLTAITIRLDGSHTALLTQLRAMHSQQVRLANRVRDLEAKAP